MAQIKIIFQLLLGAFLTFTGYSHLGSNRQEFQAQVPTWLPLDPDFVVITSGLVEIALGLSLITTLVIFKKYRGVVGLITGLFFVAIFAYDLWGHIVSASITLGGSNKVSALSLHISSLNMCNEWM